MFAVSRAVVGACDSALAESVRSVLADTFSGWRIDLVSTPEELLSQRSPVDVALLEWPWEGPAGERAMEALARRRVPVLALAPPSSPQAATAAIAHGAAAVEPRFDGFLGWLPYRLEAMLERHRLVLEQQRQLRLNQVLRRTSLDLARVATDLEAAVGVLLTHVVAAFDAPAAALCVVATPQHRAVLQAVGVPAEVALAVGNGCLAGQSLAAIRDTVVAHSDLAGHPRLGRLAPALRAHGLGAVLGTTVRDPGGVEVTGMLGVFKAPGASWTEEHRELVRAFAAEAATAVASARNVQRVEALAREAAKRAAELEGVLQGMPDAVLIVDRDGRVVLANSHARKLLPPGKPEGKPVQQLLHRGARVYDASGRLVPPEEYAVARALRGLATPARRVEVHRPDGQILHLHTSGTPLFDDDGQVRLAVTVTRDVADLVRLERAREAFLAEAAHELKTPVTTVRGFIQLIRRRAGPLPPAIGKVLESLEHETLRMAGLVEDLIEVARLGEVQVPLHLEEVDLAALVRTVLARLDVVSDGVPLVFDGPARCRIVGDPARLEQALINLVTNAVRYSPAKTPVLVTVAGERGWARLEVRDTGIGIPPDELPRVFDRFFRGSRARGVSLGGLGLGLYICRQIAERHGGRIEVESAVGAGTCFTVRLPRRPRAAGRDDQDAPPPVPASPEARR